MSIGPQIRPHRSWDFHIPKETWDTQFRTHLHPTCVAWNRDHGLIRDNAVRTWISIPDVNLPSPWSCKWEEWRHWRLHPLDFDLAMLDNNSTVFACASSGKFYLYGYDYVQDPEFGDPRLFVFDGVFPTVEAFFDDADWNLLKELDSVAEDTDRQDLTPYSREPYKFPPIRMERLRVAANEPYPRRTLWDTCPPEGAFMHRPRNLEQFGEWGPLSPRSATWPRIPDTRLPAPWSCANKSSAYDSQPWVLQHDYGIGYNNLVRAIFVPDMEEYRGDIVLSAPGGVGTYYLWWSESHIARVELWEGDLQRFHGTYASLEDFIHRADWNRLETICPLSRSRIPREDSEEEDSEEL
ncbi:hypothetical protein C8R46DRAFT_1252188 [Mycena filopes]|nr:hypothetical protein C8R46DRAFT_1252188 [Mycena filopes]